MTSERATCEREWPQVLAICGQTFLQVFGHRHDPMRRERGLITEKWALASRTTDELYYNSWNWFITYIFPSGQVVQTFSENYLRAYIVFISRKLLNGGGLLATWPFPPFDSAIIFNPPFWHYRGRRCNGRYRSASHTSPRFISLLTLKPFWRYRGRRCNGRYRGASHTFARFMTLFTLYR